MAKLRNPDAEMCRHYGYDARPVCALDVDIRAHVGGDDFGWMRRIPCVQSKLSRDCAACDQAEMVRAEDLLRDLTERLEEQA